jgi:hypothetical protein
MKRIDISSRRDNRKLSKNVISIIGNNKTFSEQRIILNRIYLEDKYLENIDVYLSELKKKWNSYKQQDKKHGILHDDFFIGFETMIKKLVSSKLQCYYCTCNCLFLYEDSYDDTQWTLDRIDNNKGHTDSNTVICCLKCNLSRGNIHQDRFIESKKISIVRKIE